jgi:hypothetical protein
MMHCGRSRQDNIAKGVRRHTTSHCKTPSLKTHNALLNPNNSFLPHLSSNNHVSPCTLLSFISPSNLPTLTDSLFRAIPTPRVGPDGIIIGSTFEKRVPEAEKLERRIAIGSVGGEGGIEKRGG